MSAPGRRDAPAAGSPAPRRVPRALGLRAAPLALVLAALAAACARASEERLNLVLVSLDTCRADRLACYGGDPAIAPELARFAAQSVVLTSCLAHSGLTAPSHMSLLSVHHVHRHGLFHNRGGVDPPYTLASTLQQAGWRTAAFTGHGSLQERHGAALGFERFESWVGEERAPHTRDLGEVVPRALDWLDQRVAPAAEPFFLFVHAYDPHAPYWPDEAARARFAGWYRGSFSPRELTLPNEYQRLLQQGEIGAEELRWINALYDAELFEADAAFGRLLAGLRERGLLERSIVVFTSDHGESLGEHGWVGHSAVWEEILRVPLVVRFPGGQWAGALDAPAQHVDLFPTLCAALGVAPPPGLQGEDLLPVIRREREPARERLRIARVGARQNQIAVRADERWKLVFQEGPAPDEIRVLQLHDLVQDPLEAHNLAKTEHGRARAAELLERYRAYRRATAAEDRRFASTPRSEPLDAQQEELLRALGYAGEGGAPPEPGGD